MRVLYYSLFAALSTAVLCSGQDRIIDDILVTLPSKARVGGTDLSPGEYRIRQISSANSPRILEFISDGSVVTTVSAVPVLNNSGADRTAVEFKKIGGMSHISRVWIEGKSYGYEIPIDDSGTSNATNTTATLRGSYAADTAGQQTAANRPESPDIGAAAAQQPAPPATPAPAPRPEPAPENQAAAQPEQPRERPADTQAAAPAPQQPAPDVARPEPAQPAPAPVAAAPDQTPAPAQPGVNQTPPMPETSSSLYLQLGGGAVMLLLAALTRFH